MPAALSPRRAATLCRLGSLLLGASLTMPAHDAAAGPVSTVFEIIPAQSSLDVTIEARGFSDSDEQPLEGTINATFDFGESGNLAHRGRRDGYLGEHRRDRSV